MKIVQQFTRRMHALPKESVTPPLKHVSQIHNVSPEQIMRTLVKKVL
jgi:hypothetical protein